MTVYDSIVIGAEGEVPAGTKVAAQTTASGERLQVLAVGDVLGNLATFNSDGKLVVAGGVGAITKASFPANGVGTGAPGVFQYDLSDAEIGDVFDLTPVPHQGSAVTIIISGPAPTSPRGFVVDYHVDKHASPDATSWAAGVYQAVLVDFDGYTHTFAGPTFPGSADGRIAFKSDGGGSYQIETIDPFDAVAPSFYVGDGLDGSIYSLTSAIGNHEGILDRIRAVCAVAPPGFDPASYIDTPTDWSGVDWTDGKGTVINGGDIAVLDRTDPTLPYLFHVDGSDGHLTAHEHPDVFNDPTRGPGNFYRVVLSSPGSPDDGTIYMCLVDDQTQNQRATGRELVLTPGYRWLSYAAGTPL